MIQPQELRIGNKIEYNGVEAVIFSIDKKGFVTLEIEPVIKGKYKYEQSPSIHTSKLKPIELTEEWALKLGFENKKGFIQGKWLLLTESLSLRRYKGCLELWSNDLLEAYENPTVHFTQNLVHTLKGQELTIKE